MTSAMSATAVLRRPQGSRTGISSRYMRWTRYWICRLLAKLMPLPKEQAAIQLFYVEQHCPLQAQLPPQTPHQRAKTGQHHLVSQ